VIEDIEPKSYESFLNSFYSFGCWSMYSGYDESLIW